MGVKFKPCGKALVISITGDIDHHNASSLRQEIDQKITREKSKNIIFDFTEVQFMDSSGIGMIIGRYKLIEKNGGIAAVCAMNTAVKRVFDLTGLGKIIKSFGALNEAEEALK